MKGHGLRDAFLKSGIPLEASTYEILQKFNMLDMGEVEYERFGKVFTTDVYCEKSFQISEELGVIINFVIECKYKSRNHNWYFVKFAGEPWQSPKSFFQHLIDDSETKKFMLKEGIQPEISVRRLERINIFDVPEVDKGIDIFDKNSEGSKDLDPNSIREAISQAIFGSMQVHKDKVKEIKDCCKLADKRLKGVMEVSARTIMTIPIVVTTAKIFLSKSPASLEKFEEENYDKLFEEVGGVMVRNPFPTESKKFSNGRVNPGFVYIINYSYLEDKFLETIKKMQKICGSLRKQNLKTT